MKLNKGITLVTLVVTIVLIIMLAGVSINTGINIYDNARVTAFVNEMTIIQEQVNIAYTKMKSGDTSFYDKGIKVSELNEGLKQRVNNATDNQDTSIFLYYSKDVLNQLGIDKVKQDVVINFNTREVYSLVGVEYKGKTYYKQYNLPGGQYNIAYYENDSQAPNFNIEKKNFGLNVKLNIKDIEYKGDVDGGQLYYGLVVNENTNPVSVQYWEKVSGDTIEIDKTGKYAIKLIDKLENQTIKTVNVAIVNPPKLDENMIPVIYDEEVQKWKKISETDGDWYDYAEKKWANIMLSDGIVINRAGYIETIGSMFVWIPRYAYKITENYHNKEAGKIDIKFLKETTRLTTDETSINIEEETGENKWKVHPAFIDGSQEFYQNSGWKEEITGMWVAKFEASRSNTTDTNGVELTSGNIKIIPNVPSWRNISEDKIFTNCIQMNGIDNIYGLSDKTYPHQMKNSEWGAVSYLTYSIYGNGEEPYINNSTTFITGNSANNVSDIGETGKVNEYSTKNGQKASSTGNIYGIYDLSGGAIERVAAYIKNSSSSLTKNALSLESAEKYYKDIYPEQYQDCESIYGDAIWETSGNGKDTNSWNLDLSKFPSGDIIFFSRGGWSNNGTSAGIFAFYDDTSGEASDYYGFRPVIII